MHHRSAPKRKDELMRCTCCLLYSHGDQRQLDAMIACQCPLARLVTLEVDWSLWRDPNFVGHPTWLGVTDWKGTYKWKMASFVHIFNGKTIGDQEQKHLCCLENIGKNVISLKNVGENVMIFHYCRFALSSVFAFLLRLMQFENSRICVCHL